MSLRTPVTLPWWFSPRMLVACVLFPAYIGAWAAVEVFGIQLTTAKGFYFLKGEPFLIGLLGLAALLYGTLLPVNLFAIRTPHYRDLVVPDGFIYGVGLAAMVGYLYWFKDLIADPGALLRMLKSGGAISYELRRNLDRTAGLASLASLSLSFTVLVCHRLWVSQRGSLPAGLRLLAWVIGLFTVFRVFAWAERLALIEIGIVFALYWVAYAPGGRAPFVMRTRSLFPLAAVTVVVVLFAIGEYYRAWESYSTRETSYWAFIFQRLLNYYAQALNSGAGMLTVLEWPTYTFQQTLDWLHKFPILLGPIFRYLMQVEPNFFLERYADPEFNNLSGLFILLYEMGIPATLVVCALLGLVAQSTFRSFKDPGNVFGLLYPVMFMTIIEFLRIWYVGNSRAFLLVLSLVLAILLARRAPAGASARTGAPRPVSPLPRTAR